MTKFILWALAIYICVECYIQFYKMDKGDKFCRIAKYLFAVLVGFIGVIVATTIQYQPALLLWLVPDIAIALFLWPTTYARATGQFKNRIGD